MIWQLIINGLIAGSGYAIVALGFTVIYGTVRFFHFAHGAVYAVGAYVAWFAISQCGIPLVPSLCFACLLAGALGVAYLSKTAHRPTLIRMGMLVFSATTIAIALSRSLLLTGCLMPVAGAAFLTMQSAVNTGLQITTPPDIRGRVMALLVLSFLGVMPLGSLAFGTLGHIIGVPRAIAAGGAVCFAWGVVLWVRPGLLAAA